MNRPAATPMRYNGKLIAETRALPRRHFVVPMPTMSKRPQKTDWGEVASWYDDLVGESGSEYHREVVLPGVMRLLAPKSEEKIIDIACGQGVLCRMLAQRGAEATG